VGIDTLEVLEAAGTKWNFLPFRPGLVGGHCIGVDPYYLTHKAQELGYHPEMVLAGRRLNDSMGGFVCSQLIKAMLKKGIGVSGSNVLVMGLTFKEDCPDLRNTRVTDIINELAQYSVNVDVTDSMCNEAEAVKEYGINLSQPETGKYDAIIIAVGHSKFRQMGIDHIKSFGKPNALVYDLKYLFNKSETDLRL
jgi:UDP-N-acetyl-D-galactosamine dehydrogenase